MDTASPHPAQQSAASVSTDAVVTTESLDKRFGRVAALDWLDVRVGRGEIHGFGAERSG